MKQFFSFLVISISWLTTVGVAAAQEPTVLGSGWLLQDVAKVAQPGTQVSAGGFKPQGWYAATVPGTVLTTLVNNKVYAEPLFGDNNRVEKIPESLARTQYWYRTEFAVPKSYGGRHVWLRFEGINYSSEVWVNGAKVGTTRGAFARGIFDVTAQVTPGRKAVLAVLVAPQPHPGTPNEHTLKNGIGKNGGITAIDGATFLSTIGWDWLPGIHDRDTGIWQRVELLATGPVVVKNPLVTTDLPLPKTDSADIAVQATVENITDEPQKGVLKGTIENIAFEQAVEIPAKSSKLVSFDAKTTAALHVEHPRLWWPNGYGKQEMYRLHLSFEQGKKVSDAQDVGFGVRKLTYEVADSDNLTISVNGVRVFIRGGNWGLDEALKRIPRECLEAKIRLHQLANMTLIRNWVGQSTGEDFYELCDKYGLLLWDEFFQPNPNDGPDPEDLDTYIANVREKIVRFRNHPSIAVWCARNEGFPPKEIDDRLRVLMAELEPTRMYQPSSTEGHGVHSAGPYYWREPREYYKVDAAFKTETGSMSVPTIESVHGMLPQKDWETITDNWAERDFARGAQHGDTYRDEIEKRYGKIANLADFVRKAQLANYEAYRAMYEGRNAALFHPATGVITWMSNPAQPSFVWQLYHYDLEPNASLFGVKKAGEMVHVQFNEVKGEVEVINNLPEPVADATVDLSIHNLDGSVAYQHDFKGDAVADAATSLGAVEFPAELKGVHFLKLELKDGSGKLLSDNFYWRGLPAHPDDLTDLEKMPEVKLEGKVARQDADGKTVVTVTIVNPTDHIALMAHVQLRKKRSGERVLPVYASDNYVSLAPKESRTIALEADTRLLQGEDALVVLDGWNVTVGEAAGKRVALAPNIDAQPGHWPVTGLPFQTVGLR